jgi:hypothetical protein
VKASTELTIRHVSIHSGFSISPKPLLLLFLMSSLVSSISASISSIIMSITSLPRFVPLLPYPLAGPQSPSCHFKSSISSSVMGLPTGNVSSSPALLALRR